MRGAEAGAADLVVSQKGRQKTLIIAGPHGQLGNKLFQTAHCMAFALENGLRVSNLAFFEYARAFEGPRGDVALGRGILGQLLLRPFWAGKLVGRVIYVLVTLAIRTGLMHKRAGIIKFDGRRQLAADSPEFLKLVSGHNAVVVQGGLFRDYASLQKHGDKIRQYFTPAEPHRERVGRLLDGLCGDCEVLVGVHVRQGDYRHYQGGRYYYATEQYGAIMKHVEHLFPARQVGFLICSNVKLSEDHFGAFRYRFGTGHLVEDLYSLAGCDYLIGPPSTYSMWASFYGQVVLYQVHDAEAVPTLEDFKVVAG